MKPSKHRRIIETSKEALCASERECCSLHWKAASARNNFVKAHRLFLGRAYKGDTPRAFALVCYRSQVNRRLVACFMDAITGTLFDARTLHCMSSDALRLQLVERNQRAAGDLLKKHKAAQIGGGNW